MIIVAAVAVLLTIAVSGFVADSLGAVDTTGWEEWQMFIIDGAAFIFLTISVAAGTGYLRNITGYIVKYIKVKRTRSLVAAKEIEYSFTWMIETVGKFEMVLVTVTPFIEIVMPGHRSAAMVGLAGLWAFIDILKSELKGLKVDVTKPV